MQEPLRRQHLSGDAHAGGYHRGADEDRLDGRIAPHAHQRETEKLGNQHAEKGDQECCSADMHQFGGLDFQSHAEEQEHHSKFCKGGEQVVGPNPVQDTGSDDNSGQDLADDARLSEAFNDLCEQLCGTEHQ